MLENLNEDMVSKLAAQFNTFPDVLQIATDGYVPVDESPSFYMGFISAVMTLGSLLSEQKVPINYDVLVALASKAALLRQGMIAEEGDTAWIDKLNEWLEANYSLEKTASKRH